MSRILSNIITANYAGRDILLPGQHLNAESYGGSRSFTTAPEPLLNAEAVSLRSYGNSQGTMTLPVCIDCESEPEAIRTAMEAVRFVDQNSTGQLVFRVGEEQYIWEAGISNLDWSIQYVGYGESSRVRLSLVYNFTLGSNVTE